ncbi:hypothetical protein FACS1894113_3550 [Alphaproteobacteria bacterium]|nr:hypothetical protein FACS1894113_3550 [Alphaproteobacteria bacterium]
MLLHSENKKEQTKILNEAYFLYLETDNKPLYIALPSSLLRKRLENEFCIFSHAFQKSAHE